MSLTLEQVRERLGRSLSDQVELHPIEEALWAIATPFTFPDGDAYSLYLRATGSGIWRITDLGHTWMAMSYENDVDKFRQGSRSELRDQILLESGVRDIDGELYLDCEGDALGRGLFQMVKTITRFHDLTFLNRERVQDTFEEDLQETLRKIVPFDSVVPKFRVKDIPDAENYLVDFMVPGKERNLFIFGVTGKDKARLVTIYLSYYLRHKIDFDSLCILNNLEGVPKPDLTRLMNVGGDLVVSLDDHEAIQRKVLKRTGT